MKKSNRTIIIICTILIVLSLLSYFMINLYLDKSLEKDKKDLELAIKKYGTVEKETVSMTVSKFNTEIMESGIEYPASDEYLSIENNEYWYGLYDDIYCFVMSDDFSSDKEKDIVSMIGIYYPKNSPNEELAQKYVKNLLKANNGELSDKNIENLIEEAKKLSSKNKNAQSGKGIALALKETDDYYNYQVIRIYK